MLIDWFTVGAQIVNFLILVGLLKHFLYRPILDAIDAREKRIAKELADADAKKTEAQKEHDEFRRKSEEFDQQRAALMDKATEEAKAGRQRILDEARQAADDLGAKRQEALKSEAHNLKLALSRRTRQEVFAIARKALADLAGASLEERMVEAFISRLREMDGQSKAVLGEALKTASEPVLVRSAFDLPAPQRTLIQQMLSETFSAQINIRFEAAPDMVSGIELATNGQKVAWSIADYLASLEKGVEELLKERDKTEAKARTGAELTQRIGKRAYALYEEQGHMEGHAAQNWEQAEREIRKGIPSTVKAEPSPVAIVRPEPEYKAEPEAGSVAKPESEAVSEPTDKDGAKPVTKVEPKPEVEAEPESEAEARPENKLASIPAAAQVEVKPEVKAKPEPEAEPETKRQ